MAQESEIPERKQAASGFGRRRGGLSGKLLVLTVLFVMLSEVMIYVPSVANYRLEWLREMHHMATVAASVLSQSDSVSQQLAQRLLKATGAVAIAEQSDGKHRLIASSPLPTTVDVTVDLAAPSLLDSVLQAFDALFAPPGRMLRVVGPVPGAAPEETVELLLPEAPLRAAMLAYSRNILLLSLLISLMTAGFVYFSIRWLLVRPIRRLTLAMEAFAQDPEDPDRIITPSPRDDEIGEAEARLAAMQQQLSGTMQQRKRLADLGLAVSKINHDLRNLLASAQLFSDRLLAIQDPQVQRFAPKLLRALDRAVAYTQSVLAYGKAGEAPPSRRIVNLRKLAEDVAEISGVAQHAAVEFHNEVPPTLEVDADPEQLFRVLMNLSRNAVEAMEADHDTAIVRRLTIGGVRSGGVVEITIADTGPGMPPAMREHLFTPFHGSGRRNGTGLGLAIAAELVRAHGGTIQLDDTAVGTRFRLTIPDRPVDLAAIRRAAAR